MSSLSDKIINGYAFDAPLGKGGYGDVYRARRLTLDRDVAVKVITPDKLHSPDAVARFRYEVDALIRLAHPHIVPLYDTWQDADGCFIAMRLMDGGSLRDRLVGEGAQPLARVLDWYAALAKALFFAHREGIVHRDLKPGNLLLDAEDEIYLADFGIARLVSREADLTPSGALMGTPRYASPEQVRGQPATPRSDIYSLGLILYEVLMGRHPFPSENAGVVLEQQLMTPVPPLSPELRALDPVIARATAKDPAARYPDVRAFREALDDAARPLLGHRFPPPPARLPRPLPSPEETSGVPGEGTEDLPAGDDARAPTPSTPVVTPTAQRDPVNPYKGLRAFDEADARYFFGRERLVEMLVSRVQAMRAPELPRLVALIGPSGSGKSSIARAGLLARLRPRPDDWLILPPLRPGGRPLDALAGLLSPYFPERALRALDDDLREFRGRGLGRLIDLLLRDRPGHALLLVDQFEEIFTQTADEAERAQFIALLADAATVAGGRLVVVLTLRADFYDRPLAYPALARLIEAASLTVTPMSADDLRLAVRGPAELPDVGLRFDPGLDAELVYEVLDRPGALPLLQFALDQLVEWRDGERLTAAAYAKMGGVRGAIGAQAEATYAALPDDAHRQVARRVFARLVEPVANDLTVARRRARRHEFETIGEGDSVVATVIERFIGARLLVGDQYTVEVAHEALFDAWPRLKDWLAEDIGLIVWRRKFAADVAAWLAARDPDKPSGGKRDDGSRLYVGLALAEAERVYADHAPEFSADERAFLDASRRRARVMRRRDRAALAVLALFALLGIGFIGWRLHLVNLQRLAVAAAGPPLEFEAATALLGGDAEPVAIGAYRLDRYEVSLKRYRLCVDAGACSRPSEGVGEADFDDGDENLPVRWVSAYQAADYCAWVGGRLPTWGEMERAARGTEGRRRPWPDDVEARPELVHMTVEGYVGIAPSPEGPIAVNSDAVKGGDTPEGARHLIGNVTEWTSTYECEADSVVVCTGQWDGVSAPTARLYLAGASWEGFLTADAVYPGLEATPESGLHFGGFRCAY